MKFAKYWPAAYLLAAILSYGHAYHNTMKYSVNFAGQKRETSPDERALGSLLISSVWPLYWSQVAWEHK